MLPVTDNGGTRHWMRVREGLMETRGTRALVPPTGAFSMDAEKFSVEFETTTGGRLSVTAKKSEGNLPLLPIAALESASACTALPACSAAAPEHVRLSPASRDDVKLAPQRSA